MRLDRFEMNLKLLFMGIGVVVAKVSAASVLLSVNSDRE